MLLIRLESSIHNAVHQGRTDARSATDSADCRLVQADETSKSVERLASGAEPGIKIWCAYACDQPLSRDMIVLSSKHLRRSVGL